MKSHARGTDDSPFETILVIDDDEDMLENLREAFEDAGYRVVVARDGLEAMRHLQHEQVTAVILDLLLPLFDGNEVYAAMQQNPSLANLPVVVTTADPTRSPPGLPILSKPFHLDALLLLVALSIHGPKRITSKRTRS